VTRASYLNSFCNPSIKRSDSSAKLLNELASTLVPGLSNKIVQVFFISQHGFPNAFGGVLALTPSSPKPRQRIAADIGRVPRDLLNDGFVARLKSPNTNQDLPRIGE